MSEWLVRIRDKTLDRGFEDKLLDSKCLGRGDVVVVCEDGWAWSKEERSNPDWRIIKMPNVSVSTAQAFLGAEYDEDPRNPSPYLRRRAFKLDVDNPALGAQVVDWLKEGGKQVSLAVVAAEVDLDTTKRVGGAAAVITAKQDALTRLKATDATKNSPKGQIAVDPAKESHVQLVVSEAVVLSMKLAKEKIAYGLEAAVKK